MTSLPSAAGADSASVAKLDEASERRINCLCPTNRCQRSLYQPFIISEKLSKEWQTNEVGGTRAIYARVRLREDEQNQSGCHSCVFSFFLQLSLVANFV
jgi:hypothetical protein